MTMTDKENGLALLREPFPANQISKLPKPTKKQTEDVRSDFKNGIRCEVCGGWHHPKVVHVDYVGHAALTDRLLDCDPEWEWAPMAKDERGLPALDNIGGLWITLTVCGKTRIGYGHADGKTGGDAIKEVIGDALRNAAMRFGAALDLWHKGDLHIDDGADAPEPEDTFDAGAERDRIKHAIEGARTLPGLQKTWLDNAETLSKIKADKPPMFAELTKAKDDRKAALTPPDPAGQAPADSDEKESV